MAETLNHTQPAARLRAVRGAWLALWAGLALCLAAASALWASEGPAVFVDHAFAALAACL